MFTVIRQHVEGYISCLMYNDNSQCFISYCKKTRDITINIKDEDNFFTSNLYYDSLTQILITDIMNMIHIVINVNISNIPDNDLNIVNKFIKDIRSQVKRRFIPSISKPYHKASSFNPKNRRIISSK